MTPILSSTKMIQQLANPLFKQDLVKKHEFYQCIYPILDDLYIPDKSYHDPHPPYFSIINDHYGYQEDDPMTPERYEFETTEAYYRIRQYKKELAMLCNETEKIWLCEIMILTFRILNFDNLSFFVICAI